MLLLFQLYDVFDFKMKKSIIYFRIFAFFLCEVRLYCQFELSCNLTCLIQCCLVTCTIQWLCRWFIYFWSSLLYANNWEIFVLKHTRNRNLNEVFIVLKLLTTAIKKLIEQIDEMEFIFWLTTCVHLPFEDLHISMINRMDHIFGFTKKNIYHVACDR